MDQSNRNQEGGLNQGEISSLDETTPLILASRSNYASNSRSSTIRQEEDTRVIDSSDFSGCNFRQDLTNGDNPSSGNHVQVGDQGTSEYSKEGALNLSKHPEYIAQRDLGSESSTTPDDEAAPLIDFPHRTHAVSYRRLLIPFLLYCTAMGAVAVPKLHVIIDAMCRQYGEPADSLGVGFDPVYSMTAIRSTLAEGVTSLSDPTCSTAAVQERMARFLMYANIISGVGCAFSGPKIGLMADRYGRKPLLAFTAFGLLFGDILSMAVIYFPERISVHWILLEFAVGGITGTFAATMAVIQAYTADCTEGSERASAFSNLHACMFLGVAFGPSLGELFTQSVGGGDMLSIFYVALACHAAFIIFVLFGITESLQKTANSSTSTSIDTSASRQCTTHDSVWQDFVAKIRLYAGKFNIYRSLKILRRPPHTTPYTAQTNLLLLACIDAIAFGVQLGLAALLVLYAEHQLNWTRMEANLFISVTNATRAIALVVVLPGLSRIFPKPPRVEPISTTPEFTDRDQQITEANPHVHSNDSADNVRLDIAVIRIALFCDMLSFIGFVVSAGPILFTISGVIAASGALASPTIQSLMTNCVETERAGELLGAITLIHAVAKSIIPAGIQLIYSLSISRAPTTVFGVLALVFGVALFLSLFIRRRASVGSQI